ncbi:hypothetical protein [Aliikangiella sp. G2MR2-5]|uniref:hypothetical protein n=1 Tax=Aliikangiella sp. G2MR2-5 TaxID=2788943 RepID=UPI0018A93FC4|nr:hypothetical protein [Aliikangiella sp. G2MR2-5]
MFYIKLISKILITALIVAVLLTTDSLAFGSLDGPKSDSQQENGDDWAPRNILRLHPIYLEPVLLDKLYETEEKAYYKVNALVQPPKDRMCDDYPDSCVLERSNE